jgi:hypothetical protein
MKIAKHAHCLVESFLVVLIVEQKALYGVITNNQTLFVICGCISQFFQIIIAKLWVDRGIGKCKLGPRQEILSNHLNEVYNNIHNLFLITKTYITSYH